MAKTRMARPAGSKYRKCSLKELKQIKGIGDATVKSLKRLGYKNVGQVYSDSVSVWGRLKNVKGISENTAKNLFRDIKKKVKC